MSVTLYNENNALWTSSHIMWCCALRLAEDYGWERSGTEDPLQPGTRPGWDGKYSVNNGQRVSSADAENLAEALAAALSDIPDDPAEGWLVSGQFRAHLGELIEHCRQGAFRIY